MRVSSTTNGQKFGPPPGWEERAVNIAPLFLRTPSTTLVIDDQKKTAVELTARGPGYASLESTVGPTEQALFAQSAPCAQGLPHAEQFCGSIVTFVSH